MIVMIFLLLKAQHIVLIFILAQYIDILLWDLYVRVKLYELIKLCV